MATLPINWRPQAIIFDMDGLLVDSEHVWIIAETRMIAAYGYEYDLRLREKHVGLRMDEYIDALRAYYPFPKDTPTIYAEGTDYFVELVPQHVTPQPGAHELLVYVTERGLPIAVASAAPMAAIDAVLAHQGWDTALTRRFSADDDARGKPAPDVYLRAAVGLGIDPTQCLALEDSPNGARAAVAAGMTCFAVPDKTHSHVEFFADITPHVFDNLNDVRAILEQLL